MPKLKHDQLSRVRLRDNVYGKRIRRFINGPIRLRWFMSSCPGGSVSGCVVRTDVNLSINRALKTCTIKGDDIIDTVDLNRIIMQ
jgi:hypothetical protein